MSDLFFFLFNQDETFKKHADLLIISCTLTHIYMWYIYTHMCIEIILLS